MAKYLLLGLHNAVAGREEEFNHWYDNQHLYDCLAVPGFVRAQRFKLDDTQIIPGTTSPWRYMVIYELDTDDPDATLQALVRHGMSGKMVPSDALDPNGIFIVLAKPITGEVTPKENPDARR
jgi:hypothetical protein